MPSQQDHNVFEQLGLYMRLCPLKARQLLQESKSLNLNDPLLTSTTNDFSMSEMLNYGIWSHEGDASKYSFKHYLNFNAASTF